MDKSNNSNFAGRFHWTLADLCIIIVISGMFLISLACARLLKYIPSVGPVRAKLAESFFYVNYWSSIITSKNLSNENINTLCFQWYYKNSSFWHFNSRFFLKTTKTPVFVFITEIFWRTFWRNNWQSIIGVVERLSYCRFLTI